MKIVVEIIILSLYANGTVLIKTEFIVCLTDSRSVFFSEFPKIKYSKFSVVNRRALWISIPLANMKSSTKLTHAQTYHL